MSNKKHIVTALDVGTTKAIFVIGEVQSQGLDVIGIGEASHTGVVQGAVIHIEETARAIKKAKEEAELMAGCSVDSVWLGIGGSHIQSFDSSGMVAIRGSHITDEDIQRVIGTARAVAIPSDREVLHVLPNGYKVDQQEGINNPIGMSGVRLESSVRIVTGQVTAISNFVKCVEAAGLKAQGLVLQSLASATAVVSEDEKQMGVGVVDMGGGYCDVLVYDRGRVVYTDSVAVGGQNVTYDVAIGLKTTRNHAEELKRLYGTALRDQIGVDEIIEVEGVGGQNQRSIGRKELCEIIEARVQETLELVRDSLNNTNLTPSLGSGLVFTGGACQMKGLMEMGEFIFDLPLRLGRPRHVGGLKDAVKSPSYATAMGLLLYATKEEQKQFTTKDNTSLSYSVKGLFKNMREFFLDFSKDS